MTDIVIEEPEEPTGRAPVPSVTNDVLPVYIGLPLLGRRVELEVRVVGGLRRICRVVVAVHRAQEQIVVAPARARRQDGSWATTDEDRQTFARREIGRITVLDLDGPRL